MPSKFVPGTKILAQKVDWGTIQGKSTAERLAACNLPESSDLTTASVTNACYVIKPFGDKTLFTDYEMCQESYFQKKLVGIQCRRFAFLPDGPFIQLPSYTNVEPFPDNGRKDSLAMSVGTCAKISD